MRVLNFIKALSVGATFLTVIGCGPSQEEEQAAAQSAAAYHLLDPSSAQFREVEFKGGDIVCGQINGKNRMGAYSGFHDFIAYRGEEGEWRAELVLEDPYGHEMFRKKCIGEAQAQADMDAAMPPVTLDDNDGASAIGGFANGETDAEKRCIGSWARDEEFLQLNFSDRLIQFNSFQGGGYGEPYEIADNQLQFFEGDEQFALTCAEGIATITNITSGGARQYELMRD